MIFYDDQIETRLRLDANNTFEEILK